MAGQCGQCWNSFLFPPGVGFPNPSYPALFRRATTYAWRNRLRKIPTGRSERTRGEILTGGRGTLGGRWRRDSRWIGGAPELLAGLGGPNGQTGLQEAKWNGAAVRAKRYAHRCFVNMSNKSDGKHCVF